VSPPKIDSRGGSHAAGKREGRSDVGTRPAGGGMHWSGMGARPAIYDRFARALQNLHKLLYDVRRLSMRG
jgi:hypothetical protein